MTKQLARALGAVSKERGASAERRVLLALAEAVSRTEWLRGAWRSTPDEDARGIDIVANTDVGQLYLQVKSSQHERAYKLSRVMDGPLRYRFYRGGKDGRGRQVRFCYATVRNVAGYYLGWREVIGKTGGHRDQWTASKVRRRMAERRT